MRRDKEKYWEVEGVPFSFLLTPSACQLAWTSPSLGAACLPPKPSCCNGKCFMVYRCPRLPIWGFGTGLLVQGEDLLEWAAQSSREYFQLRHLQESEVCVCMVCVWFFKLHQPRHLLVDEIGQSQLDTKR